MIRRPPRSTQSRSSAASDVYKRQQLAKDIHDHPEKVGMCELGFKNLDKYIGRQAPGEFVLYQARTNTGKSMFLMHTALHNYKRGLKGIIITIEMSASQYLYRMDSNITGIEHKRFASGSITEDVEMLNRCDHRISCCGTKEDELFVYCVPSGCTPAKVRSIIANNPFNPDFVVLDYAGDMKSGIAGVSDYDAGSFGVIYSSLKELAGEFNFVMYSAQQTKRGVKKVDTESGSWSDIASHKADIMVALEITKEDDEYITIIPPVFRTDISIPEDIYEDVGRIYGYENILPKLPTREINAVVLNEKIALKEKIRNILTYSGCNELDTYSFTSKETLLGAKQDPNFAYHIKNALSPELEFMRISILTSLLQKAKENIQKNISPLCIYEFNIPHQKGYMDNFQLPKEDWHLSMVFSSKEKFINGSPYYQIKRYAEKIFNSIGAENISYELVSLSSQTDLPIWIKCIIPTFNPNQSALIKYHTDGTESIIGIIGDIDYEVKNNFKLPDFTAAVEINLEELLKIIKPKTIRVFDSKFPSISQDVCFTVPSSIKYCDIENSVLQIINTRDRVATIECIDIYQKSEHSKNVTLRITIEHQNKTLSDKEFGKIREKIEERIKNL